MFCSFFYRHRYPHLLLNNLILRFNLKKKNKLECSIVEERYKALMLLYEQKNMEQDIEEIINTFAKNTLERYFFKSVVLAVLLVCCI